MNLSQFQSEVGAWAERNFGSDKGLEAALNPLMGVGEEYGELLHSVVNTRQQRRTTEDHVTKGKDAVGDLMVFLADFCNRVGWSLDECVTLAWDEVKDRDWKKFPKNGRTE